MERESMVQEHVLSCHQGDQDGETEALLETGAMMTEVMIVEIGIGTIADRDQDPILPDADQEVIHHKEEGQGREAGAKFHGVLHQCCFRIPSTR